MEMGYLIVAGLMALWVLRDARQRLERASAFGWAIGTLLVPFLALPLYHASRPLRAGETRTGGKPWNILKDFALTWTVLLLAVEVSMAIELAAGLSAQVTEADKAGYGFAAVLGLALIAMYWFFPTVGALALGFLLRRPSVVERGPTGRAALTAGSEGAAAP
jgi:hypothetical protein